MNSARRNSYFAGMASIAVVGLGLAGSSGHSPKLLITALIALVLSVALIGGSWLYMRRRTSEAVKQGADYAAAFHIKGAIELFPEAAASRAAMTRGPGDVRGILVIQGETVTLKPFNMGEQEALEEHSWNADQIPLLSVRAGREFTGIPFECVRVRIFGQEVDVKLAVARWPKAGNPQISDVWPGGINHPSKP